MFSKYYSEFLTDVIRLEFDKNRDKFKNTQKISQDCGGMWMLKRVRVDKWKSAMCRRPHTEKIIPTGMGIT